MKKALFFISIVALALTGCNNVVTEMVTYRVNEPVFMSLDSFRNAVKVSKVPHTLSGVGKMCFYNNYLYISEPEKGIHIINNTDPANPKVEGFIDIPGNADLAIRNGKLYADSYIDLVWFDVNDPANPTLQGRMDSIFVSALPPIPNVYGIDYNATYSGASKGVVVGWKLTEKTEPAQAYTGGWWKGGIIMAEYDVTNMPTSGSGGAVSTGVNGSMSSFAIYNDKLYTVINNSLNIFDLTGDKPTRAADNMYVGWNVETIFSYKTNLFFGTTTGMLIYSVADPLKPVYQSSVTHAFGCDPVIVDNDLAYVTINSSGNRCGQSTNELMIVDVKDVKSPKMLVSYGMTSPKGLGIDNGKLFLCDDGLKIYKITTPETLLANKLVQYPGMNGFDVIPYSNILMMVADDGLYQYDYSDVNNIKQISKIAIVK